jgi:hypothetical protein
MATRGNPTYFTFRHNRAFSSFRFTTNLHIYLVYTRNRN